MQFQDAHIQAIKKIAPDASINVIEDKKEILDMHLGNCEILIYSFFDYPDLVDFTKAKNLKWVHTTSAGASDIANVLKNTDIILTNSSGVHPIPIAEHVFTFLLMFARQIYKSYRMQIEDKKWFQDYNLLAIEELYGKTIGIVGFGRIGKRIAKVSKGFDMHVLALLHNSGAHDPNVDMEYLPEQLNKLLNQSDFVINCLPLTNETKNFFTMDKFKQMKSSAYFINIGRGKTVDENDLINALKQNIIAGAGLDVFAEEPLSEQSELWNLKNIIITPHYAGLTPRYIDRVVEIFCTNLQSYLQKKPMPNLVDKEKGY